MFGQPLALEIEHRLFEVLARPPRLMDQHDHRRGGAELRSIVRGGQRGTVEGMEPEVEVVRARYQRGGDAGRLGQGVGRIGLRQLLQRHAALVPDGGPSLPGGPWLLLLLCPCLHHRQADQHHDYHRRPPRSRRQCSDPISHRSVLCAWSVVRRCVGLNLVSEPRARTKDERPRTTLFTHRKSRPHNGQAQSIARARVGPRRDFGETRKNREHGRRVVATMILVEACSAINDHGPIGPARRVREHSDARIDDHDARQRPRRRG